MTLSVRPPASDVCLETRVDYGVIYGIDGVCIHKSVFVNDAVMHCARFNLSKMRVSPHVEIQIDTSLSLCIVAETPHLMFLEYVEYVYLKHLMHDTSMFISCGH